MNIFEIFLEKLPILREMVFFTKEDLVKIWIDNNSIEDFLNNKLIIEVYDFLYTLSEKFVILNEDTIKLFWLKYDKSAYISLETALDFHNVLFSNPSIVKFASNKPNKEIKFIQWFPIRYFSSSWLNEWDIIKTYYKSWNKAIWELSTTYLRIASLERSLIDLFYSKKKILDENTIDAMNFDFIELKKKINFSKLKEMSFLTKNNVVIETTKNFINWINSNDYRRDRYL